MGFLDKIDRAAAKINNFAGKVTDTLGFFGTDVTGLVEGRVFKHRDHFHQLLDQWDFAIPSRNLWVIYIERFPVGLFHEANNRSLVNILDLNGVGLDSSDRKWKILKNVKSLTRYEYQETPSGCTFAQGVAIPGENMSVSHVKPNNNRGLIPGRVAGERSLPQDLILEFRETNTSFVDNIVRPWIIMGSHYGFVARDPGDIKNVQANVHVYQLGKTMTGIPNVHRKHWTYYNCVPTRINQAQLTYDYDTVNTVNQTTWSYTHHSVEQLPALPMSLVMDQIIGGGVMNILDKNIDNKVVKGMKKLGKTIDSVKNAGKVLKNLF